MSDGSKHLREAVEILGEGATPCEVMLAASYIRRGYLTTEEMAALHAIGVERFRNPEPVELEEIDADGVESEAVTGTPSSVEFGFAPEPRDYWTPQVPNRHPQRRGARNV